MYKRYLISVTLLFVVCLTGSVKHGVQEWNISYPSTPKDCIENITQTLSPFEGTFGSGSASNNDVVTFSAQNGQLLMHPALWSGPMVLQRVKADSFVVSSHPRFAATFIHGPDNCANKARIFGLSENSVYERLDEKDPRPIQLLLGGQPKKAARKYAALDPTGQGHFTVIGTRLLQSIPTKIDDTIAFLKELSNIYPKSADIHALLGDAFIFIGKHDKAQKAYERALAIDATNTVATEALKRLGKLSVSNDKGWKLPFDLSKLFILPQPEEIDLVWERWKQRNIGAQAVEIVFRKQIDLNGVHAEARVIAHKVHGKRHYGVVIVPSTATPEETLPVLIEAKGVSPSFFPLEVPNGLTAPLLMDEARGNVIYFAPSYRGERIIIGTDTLISEGDRSDAWDGATDDTIAFLRAALQKTPEADSSRMCIFGRSRGGTVALLSGIREKQIDCVVSWAAPTDWFSNMDLNGWTQKELVADGLRNQALPGETGGQFINYFLSSSLAGKHDLQETRLHMIASSPLYFARKLPLAQTHWGMEDTIVPIINGESFMARYKNANKPKKCIDVHFHSNAGHDQDRQLTPIQTKNFFLASFNMTEDNVASCRKK